MKINKRGSIEWESDKLGRIILAVICIAGLALLGVHIYNILTTNHEFKQAGSSLDNIVAAVNSNYTQVQVYNPSNWFLESFPMTVKNVVGKSSTIPVPPLCSNVGWDNCLCICMYNFQGSPECDSSHAVCVESNFSLNEVSAGTWSGVREIYMNHLPLTLEINQTSKTLKQK